MGIHFNAQEVLAMAIKIEDNAAAFYHRAHALQKHGPHASLLESLAKMEERHKNTFEDMRRHLPEEFKAGESFDPYEEAALYLAAAADAHGGEGDRDAAARLTGEETMAELLKLALALEKKSILYYVGLRDIVPKDLGQAKIDAIINEEKKHVVELTRVKMGLS